MSKIEIFDPAATQETETDPARTTFAADLEWARKNGCDIDHFDPQHKGFFKNATANAFVAQHGVTGLPLTLVDGVVALSGRFPQRVELMNWMGWRQLALTDAARPSEQDNCGGLGCG